MLPVCSKCDKSGLYQNWPIIGGIRSGSMIAGGVLLCPACATEEIARLRAALELDTEFAHAPGCTGRGISRMCAGCIEAEQLRHFAEIDRLTAEAVSLRHLAADAVLMARHGEYSNGVTDPTGMIDEGSVKAGEVITDLDRRAVALNVTVGSILYDHTRFYGQAAEVPKGCGSCEGPDCEGCDKAAQAAKGVSDGRISMHKII